MKSATTGAVSGCLVWIIACGVISMCILPVSMAIGLATSFSDFAIRQTGPYICPETTTTDVYTHTTSDGMGRRATTYKLQCIDENGNVVKEDQSGYTFLWVGIFTVSGLTLAGVLAFVLAAPAGVLITKFINRIRRPNLAENIEPR